MITAGLWRYGDWRHVATGCDALVIYKEQEFVKRIWSAGTEWLDGKSRLEKMGF